MCEACTEFSELLNSIPDKEKLTKQDGNHPLLRKAEIEKVFSFMQSWFQRQCICCFRDPKNYDKFHWITQNIVLLVVKQLKAYKGEDIIRTSISKRVDENEGSSGDEKKNKRFNKTPGKVKIVELEESAECSQMEKDEKPKSNTPGEKSDARSEVDTGGGGGEEEGGEGSGSVEKKEGDKKPDEEDINVGGEEEEDEEKNDSELWTIAEMEKLLHFLAKVFLLNFPLYAAYKQTVQNKMEELTQHEASALNVFCDLHDLEIPIHLLRNVCLFCRNGGVQAMTACFEHKSLPVPVAHAIIAVVCNLKLWLNFRTIMELFIPLRSRVLRYMCSMADKELRTQDFMWTAVKDPMDSPISFDRDGLNLAFKYFISSTLTMRLAGIAQINTHINMFNEMCNSENIIEVESVGQNLASWLIDNNIISHIFGPNLHVEVIKQSHVILNFLAMECKITNEHIDIIWQAAQLKHCSKQVHDLLPPLIKNLEPGPVLHLYHLLCKLEPKDHTEQSLVLASALIKIVWNSSSSCNDGPGFLSLSKTPVAASQRRSRRLSHVHMSSSDNTNSEGDSSQGSEGHKSESEASECPKRKKRKIDKPVAPEEDTSDESIKIEEVLNPLDDEDARKGSPKEASKVRRRIKASHDPRQCQKQKMHVKQVRRKAKVDKVDMESSEEEVSRPNSQKIEQKTPPSNRNRKNISAEKLKPNERTKKENVKIEECSDDNEDDDDEDDDEDDEDESDSDEEANAVNTPVKANVNQEVPNIVLRQGNTEFIQLVGDQSSPDSGQGAVMTELASLVQGSHNSNSYIRTFQASHEMMDEMLSPEEGSLSSRMSNKSEKNMADFDGEDSWNEWRQLEIDAKAHIAQETLADIEIHSRFNKISTMVGGLQELAPILSQFNLENVCKPGNTLLWDLIQDDKIGLLGEGLALEAEKALCNLLCYNSDKLIRMKFIEGCLDNVAKNWSVVVSLRMLPKLFTSFQQLRGGNMETNHVTLWAMQEHSMMDRFFENLRVVTCKGPIPLTHVQVRLQFLTHIYSPLGLPDNIRLSVEELDTLWSCLTSDRESCDELFSWLLKQAKGKDQHALHVETLKHLYTKKLPSLEPETISMTALSLYQQLCNMARLSSANLDAPIAVAMDHLWRIALRANNTDVSMAAIQYLNSYYMGRQLEQESEFVSQCMTHLAGATQDLATNEEASLLCIQRALLLLKTHLETFKKRYAYHLRKWALEGQCIGSHVIGERGGAPLKVIIQPAGMVDKVTLDMLSTDYVADLRAEVAKWWEMLTAKQAAMPSPNNSNLLATDGPIRMITQGQELTTEFDEKTLQEIGFKDLQMVFISMGASRQKKRGDSSLDTPSVLPPPPRECLPTLLLLLPHYFEQLFRLMDTLSAMKTPVKGGHQIPHTKAQVLSRRVWDILTLLPTNSTLLQGFRHLDSESKLKELLDPASPQKLMYSLYIVESLSRNPPSSIPRSSGEPLDITDSINWSQKFVEHGGLKYLFNIFMSGVLQVSIGGSEWHQDCLACLLKLLCQLGFQPSENDSAESLRANRRKRAQKLEKITVQKLSQAMLQEMKIDTVIPRLTSILYEASLPRDPNHYKTGFWGRAQVVQYAMSVVVSWAHTVNGVREALCAEERFIQWLRRLILEEPEPGVRREVCSALYKLCTPQHAPAMLAHLLQFLDNAEKMRPQNQEVLHQPFEDGKEPYGPACRDYFWLLCRLVDSLSDDLVRVSIEDPSACIIDIEGLANRVHESIISREYLERRHNTVEDDGLIGLLNLMCNLLKHNPPFKTEKQGEILLDQVFDFLFALPDPANRHFPKCKSQTARSAAYDLLVELVKGSVHNYKHLHEKLLSQHNPGPHSPYPWEYWPHDDGRAACGYVGLTNLGATCYMASCMQHLYMMPQARLEILRAQCDPSSKHQLTLHELQRMFAYLLESERKAYNPRSFCKVYTMDHQPLNTGEQKDMAEFFIDLVSKLEEMTPELKKLVKTLFGGVISNNVVSLDCDHVSRTLEEFYTVRCQVADMRNLYESLDEVTVKDTLEGDNMYTCSQCGKKVRAEKRACFKKLPQILCFNTMRYTFNMVTMLKEKVNTHFSFPMRLDMSGYVEKHLMPQHYQEEKRQSEKDGKEPDETYEYDLIGVTVHTGTADGGHYYSFIRDRDRAKDKWFLFNDAEVKPFDPNQIAAECFGGEMTSKTYDSVTDKFMDLSFEKTNSAYMLFYEWTRGEEQNAAGEGGSRGEEGDGEGVSGGGMAALSSSQALSTITLSTELESWIWQDNMHFLQDKNIFEHTYFQFMWQICGYIPQTLTNCEEVTQMAAQLTTTFFMETFIHAKEKPTMVQWMELLTKQFVSSQVACEWFLQHMAHNSWWPVQILIKCPNQIVRQMFQRLTLHVINQLRSNHAPLFLKMDSDDEGLEECDPDKIGYQSCVTMFVRMLLSLMEHGAKPHLKHLTEYFALLYDFSKMGEEESQFMISVRAISTMVNFYLGQKLHDYVEVFSEEEEEDDVIPMPADKYKPASLEKMITLVAMLVEKSRGPDHNLRLSNVDYSAIAGGKGFPFLFQQIKDYINLHQTRNLIYSLCRWNERLATHIVAMIFSAIQKHADICQPFFKLLTLLTEMSGGPNGLPCFTQLVLTRVWDVAEVCPHSALEWLAIQVTRNKIAHQWVMQNLDTWVEHYLLAHGNQRVRSSAAYLLVSLVPSPQFRQCYRAARQHKELLLPPDSQEILHTVYTVLLRLLKKARHYTDINTHSSSKLTTYFTLLNFFAVSKKEKLMFGQYLLDLWQLFHPKLSEPGIAVHLNKQALLLFWYHVSTDCPENVQLILQNAHIVKNIAFNYILADHDDQDVVTFNRTMLPAYYGLLRLCCQQSRAFTRQLATHQNINWAFKNITPYPTQYSAAVDELFKLMQIFVAKYPDTTENEIIEINNFRKQTINLYLQVLDGRSCWATLISAFRILVETDEDRLYVMYSGGLQMCFESFHTLHVMYHEATACHVTGDVLDMLSILLDLAKCLKFHRDTKDVRSLLLSCKDWMEVLRKLVTLLNTYNPPEMRNQCIDVLKELVFLLPTEVLHVLVPLLSHCHSAFQESANAVPMGPYFPRRGHKMPPPGLKASSRPIRPMVQMAVPHNLVDAAKGTDPEYDQALSLFYTPYHNFIDVMCRLAINHDCMNDALVNLSAIVGFEGVPLHLTFFPKLWLDIHHAQNVDRKYITMLTNCNYFVDYVEAVLLDERPSLNIDIIYDFLVTYFPKVAEQVLTDQTCLLMESIVTTLAENMAQGQLNVAGQASRLNGDLRALALVYSVELPVIPHPQLEPVLNQLITEINKESGECPWKKRKLATDKEEEKTPEKPAEESKASTAAAAAASTSSTSPKAETSSAAAGCSKEPTGSQSPAEKTPSPDWLETLDTTVTSLLAAISQKNNNEEDA